MATVTTKSKRKSRKRKYAEMMKETKQIREMQQNNNDENDTENTDNDTDNDHDNGHDTDSNDGFDSMEQSQLSQCSQISQSSVLSQVSIPSPSKHNASLDIDDIECDGLLLKSQKANLDELTYLIRGIQCKQNETELKDDMFNKLKSLVQLGLWLKQEKNQLLLRGSKHIPIILNNLRILSRIYNQENSIICAIIALLLILTKDNLTHFTDVSVNILIRLMRNTHKIEDIIYSLRQFQSASSSAVSSSRRSRRNRNHSNNNKDNHCKIAHHLSTLYQDTICASSIGYIASFLLVEIVTFCIHNIHNESTDDDYGEQIVDYMCHPAVIYKLGCIVQIECALLECRQKIEDIHLNEFILLELITRNQSKSKKVKDSSSKQTEKEGLLKILDCIGIGLRFSSHKYKCMLNVTICTPMSCDENKENIEIENDDDVDMVQDNANDVDIGSIERFLVLILKVLTNVTNCRNVSLKPDTLDSIFYLLSYYDDIVDDVEQLLLQKGDRKNYQLICLILGVFINCCERNKTFRISFNKNKINNMNAIDFLLRLLIKSRTLITQIQVEKKKQNEDNDEDDHKHNVDDEKDKKLYKAYTEYKVISYYVSLLLGFLLQSTDNFKYIASKMNELSLILLCLQQFLEFQTQLPRNANSNHTMTIITKIIEIVQIRNETLKNLQCNVEK